MFVSLKTWHKVKQLETRIAELEETVESLSHRQSKMTNRLRARTMNEQRDPQQADLEEAPAAVQTAPDSGSDRSAIREALRLRAKTVGVRGVT